VSGTSEKIEQRRRIAKLYGKALDIAKEKLGKADPNTMETRGLCAYNLMRAGKLDEAIIFHTESVNAY
jgi:hypothetical protein